MVDVEQVRKTIQKAISILEEKSVPKALKWIEENGVGLSDEVIVDKSKDRSDFSDCFFMNRFTYKDNFYEIFREKSVDGIVDDKSWIGGAYINLMVNGKPVFVLKIFGDDIDLSDESVGNFEPRRKIEIRMKVLKLGRWIDDLPSIVECEEAAMLEQSMAAAREQRRLADEADQVWATELSENLDLGDYES